MRDYEDPIIRVERRRTQLRVIFFSIIMVSMFFYLLGIWLWLSAPDADAQQVPLTSEPTVSALLLDQTATERLTYTPRSTQTASGPLVPTPIQIIPQPTAIQFPTLP